MNLYLAGCLLLNSEGKILFLHRKTAQKDQWETPGGKIDSGETPEETAVRELQEEAGVKVKLIKKLGQAQSLENDLVLHYTWFLAEVMEGTPRIGEPQTFCDLQYFSWEELISMKNKLSSNGKKLVETYLQGKISLT